MIREKIEIPIYQCNECGCKLPPGAPREEVENRNYCGDCAFKLGLITENELIKGHYFWLFGLPGLRAAVHDGKVYVGQGKFFGREHQEIATVAHTKNGDKAEHKKERLSNDRMDNFIKGYNGPLDI